MLADADLTSHRRVKEKKLLNLARIQIHVLSMQLHLNDLSRLNVVT